MKPYPLRLIVFVPGDLASAVDDVVAVADQMDRDLGGAGVRQSGFAGSGRRVAVLVLPRDKKDPGWPDRARTIAAEFRAWANRRPPGADE